MLPPVYRLPKCLAECSVSIRQESLLSYLEYLVARLFLGMRLLKKLLCSEI
jgi:hypothetical protein